MNRPRLPPLQGRGDPFVVFRPVAHPTVVSPPVAPRTPVERVEVPDTVNRLHPAICHVRSILRNGIPDNDGLLTPRGDAHCMVRVSAQQLDRACRILQGLATAFATRGRRLVYYDQSSALGVEVSGTVFTFVLVEQLKRLPVVLTDGWKAHEYADRGWSIPDTLERRASGALDLRVKDNWRTLVRWSDRADSPLEQRLHEVVADFDRLVKSR